MTIHVALRHVTSYRYDRLVALGPQTIRLRPAPHCRTPILAYSLNVSPKGHFLNWQQDPQSNWLARVVFPEKVDHLSVAVDLLAEMDGDQSLRLLPGAGGRELPLRLRARPAGGRAAALPAQAPGRARCSATTSPRSIAREQADHRLPLRPESAPAEGHRLPDPHGAGHPDAASETLGKRSGSCRDSGWLLVQLLRHLGFAARFVSGYLIQLKPDVKSLDGPSGARADFTDLHAWCEVYLPGAGWVGLDPTSGCFAGEGHIPLACAAEPSHAAPISGAVEKCEVAFDFEMTVTRIHEDAARHQALHATEQWTADRRAGRAGRRGAEGGRRAPDHGRRADLRLDRRHGGRRVEHRRRRPDQARARRHADPPPARPLRAGRLAALRPGQVVSGREPAALGLRALLARRRPAALARRRPDRDRSGRTTRPTPRTPRSCARGIARASASEPTTRMPAYEDPWHYLTRRSRSCRSTSIPSIRSSRTPRSARGWRAVFARGLGQAGRLCAAGAALERRATASALALRALAHCGKASCSWCRAIRRSACACRSAACPGCRPASARMSCSRRTRWRTCRRFRRATLPPALSRGRRAADPGRASARDLQPQTAAPDPKAATPVRTALASSRATAGSASSCRRSRPREDYLELRRRDRGRRRRARRCRCTSKAIRRRTIRGSTSSR